MDRIEHVCSEQGNISKIVDRVTSLEKTRERTNVLIDLFTKTTADLSETMKKVETTMLSIKHSLDSNENKISHLNDKVDELTSNQEKNKIDIRDLLRNILIKGSIGVLGVYGGYEVVAKLTE